MIYMSQIHNNTWDYSYMWQVQVLLEIRNAVAEAFTVRMNKALL